MEFSGFLDERGWRADSLWKPRKFILKGKALRSYSSGQLRSTYVIDAESFITVIRPGVNDHGVKSFADDKHKHVFSICTKIYDPAFRKSKLVLSAPDERALNSWVKVLGECAFDGETIDVPEIWPGAFRNQVNLFQVSYYGRNVTDGSHYTSTQLELPPFSSSADTRIGAKSNFKLLKHAWSKSPKIKANVTNTGAAGPLSLQSSGLKLFYTLILVASETMPGQPEHWVRNFCHYLLRFLLHHLLVDITIKLIELELDVFKILFCDSLRINLNCFDDVSGESCLLLMLRYHKTYM